MPFAQRLAEFRDYMKAKELDLVVVSSPENQYYLTGFRALMYSRPIMTVLTQQAISIIVPGIEEQHAREEARVDEVHVYYEHPERTKENEKTGFDLLQKIVSGSKLRRIGIEDGFATYGLAQKLSAQGSLIGISEFITRMRIIKDSYELAQLVKAGQVVSGAVKASLASVKAGKTELQIENAGNEFILEHVSTHYPHATLDYLTMTPSGVERSIIPHLISSTRRLQEQDIAIHTRQVGLFGYRAECERTFFVGQPSEKQVENFHIMCEARQAAIKACCAGNLIRDVDDAGRSIIQKAGYGEYALHRSGHGIGLEGHEAPYLRFDNEDRLEVGMVVTIEPGFYLPGMGGFRHSDTFIVTEGGPQQITEAPSSLNELLF